MGAKPRRMWESLVVLEVYRINYGRILKVVIGGDDPNELTTREAMELGKKVALKKGFRTTHGMGEIKLFGQNALATRAFYYKR